ncbi:hypothetical protein C497_00725 [Halalkalicoccus jeotgali B3]|uniref:Uncharacterized protein n=1 Tax=Halalkalicoccus jeotgali (strain DSM 18796 / CECT 7217 / JCM 14584 / KCTC 4019 / B3) TaxID=795797 RepID=D8JCH1_HALJB|nr:hypothetical protein HacjB3_18693 [Halalkalicoccus jeotgali B3]ELY41554.1 hypothetical protein C497_00725 [Halalkalicoccus jeotgali B3]
MSGVLIESLSISLSNNFAVIDDYDTSGELGILIALIIEQCIKRML